MTLPAHIDRAIRAHGVIPPRHAPIAIKTKSPKPWKPTPDQQEPDF